MPKNRGAWITETRSKHLVVQDAPFPTPQKDEIVIKNACVAINPVDYKLQEWDFLNLQYPAILGCEVAGEIFAVGDDVRNFQIGQRVIGNCHSMLSRDYKNAAFQEYTVVLPSFTAPIPDTMPFSSAVVLPVSITTASAALFEPDNLGLAPPLAGVSNSSVAYTHKSPSSEDNSTILVWGGSTSVGCAAIQLARAVGLEVITTASKRNFELCKAVGAHQVFDRESPSVVDDIVAALQGKVLVGAFNAVGLPDTVQACVDVIARTEGKKVVATTLPVDEAVDRKGIEVKFFHSVSILGSGLASTIWNDFLPQALQKGTIIPKPDALVVGHSLEDIQKGLDRARQGYSAAKIVVML